MAATVFWRFALPEQDLAWDRVQSNGVIVFGTDATFPPFSALDVEGAYFGFDIDLARAIAVRLGLRAEFELTSFDALIGSLVVGRSDVVISAFVEQPQRLHEAHFTQPYFNSGTVLVIPGSNVAFNASGALKWAQDRTIAVEYGAQGDVILRRWERRVSGVTPVRESSAREALFAVAADRAAGALVDATSAFEFVSLNQDVKVVIYVEDVPYVLAVAAQSPRLRRELDRVLAEMEVDGALGLLRALWFGEAGRTLQFVGE